MNETEKARRAPVLVIIGVIALLVSAWGLAGGGALPDGVSRLWVLVGVAVVVGIGMVVLGAKSG
ncbi:hypothetical protein HH308_07220 [Gordonia sp. TBRC 11910]|uniref:Uncharacterized protein n=1 Tax=Gordonia asplenii TaxID=2725283 RepID=A0A848KPP9_9ACTN|nr:hypothetical protein [Gordonia asplenii]NMO01004.1 hypothetical protein [Gordonia asplenii]